MLLRRTPPAPPASFIECLWYAEREALPHTRERGLPTGCADIIIPLRHEQHILRYDSEADGAVRRLNGGVIQGPRDRFSVRGTEGASRVIGVHFHPAGAAAWFGGALPELRNRTLLLEDLWGAAARSLRERLQHAPSPQPRCSCWKRTCCNACVAHRRPTRWSCKPSQPCAATPHGR
jgi:hypothetical protein